VSEQENLSSGVKVSQDAGSVVDRFERSANKSAKQIYEVRVLENGTMEIMVLRFNFGRLQESRHFREVTPSTQAERETVMAPPPAPSANEINALPDRIRRWVHDLETRCDPAGDLRDLRHAEDRIRELEAALRGATGAGA
jgi:hypothetical protein